MPNTKIFILDTNVLIQDPGAIEKLGDSDVVLPLCVIEELDKLKNDPAIADSVRLASRNVDAYRKIGSLKDGVPKGSGGRIFVDTERVNFGDCSVNLDETNDNRIVLVALRWQQRRTDHQIIVKSNDVNVRIIANALGVLSEAYEYDRQIPSSQELYTGTAVIELSRESNLDIFQCLSRDNVINAESVCVAAEQPPELFANQCCFLKRPNGDMLLAIYKKNLSHFRSVKKKKAKIGSSEIIPVNAEQLFAYTLLSDPAITLVTLRGKAGSGKTLMALLAGYDQLDVAFKQLLVYRPNIEIGKSLGYLPGNLDEKFQPWAQPIVDNLDLVIRRSKKSTPVADERPRGRRDKDVDCDDPKSYLHTGVGDFICAGLLEIAPINFLRGRSLHQRFIIIDEAQNLTPHEIKTIITRVGAGSKIVLTGDTDQIDNRYLNSVSNGLSYAIEKFKGQEVFGHVTLQKTERSHLAELAANLL